MSDKLGCTATKCLEGRILEEEGFFYVVKSKVLISCAVTVKLI